MADPPRSPPHPKDPLPKGGNATAPRHDDATLAVHAGEVPDPTTGALDPPLVLSNAFAFGSAEEAASVFAHEHDAPVYGRWGNPTVRVFERKMAALERADDAVALASGMAAVHAAITACVRAGERVVFPSGVYAETARLLRGPLRRLEIASVAVDMTDPAAVEAALDERTRLVWVETPANPTVAVYDIGAIAELAHARGAQVVVDSTFATPFHQRPLEHGADLVVHAATKGIGGHGDAIGGVIAGAAAACARIRDDAVRGAGAVMSPFVAWLLTRGARTLPLRQARASGTAGTLAERLDRDPRVATVHYPGLVHHPGHAVACRQMRGGFGAQLAFEVRGGVEVGRRVYDALSLVTRAVSLGDLRTLATYPATTTHASVPREAREAAGIGDGLLRLSVGIEDPEDLWRDLDQAFGA